MNGDVTTPVNYKDLGYDRLFQKQFGIEKISVEAIPDLSGPNIDRIIESFPIDQILPTGTLFSEDKRIILNMKEGYLSFLNDFNEEAVRFGKQNDGKFGFFIRKHTGDQILDEEGIKDLSVATRDDVVELASKPKKETEISSLPFTVKRLSGVIQAEVNWSDWQEILASKISFSIRGKGIGLAICTITGWTAGRELLAVHYIDGERVKGTDGLGPMVYIQQTQRETVVLVTPFDIGTGTHTISTATQGRGTTGKAQIEVLTQNIMLFGKEIATT